MSTPVPPRQQAGHADRRLPLLVVVMVTVLVAAGLFAADRVSAVTDRSPALAFVPRDGRATKLQRETRLGGASTTSKLVQESASMSGTELLGGLDWNLGLAVLRVLGADRVDRMRFWRTTTTEIANLGSSQQLVRVYRADAALELVAESGPGGAEVYSPALVELPATAAAGDAWHGEGTVGARRYRSDFRAAPAEPSCLRVTGTIVESTADGAPGPSRTVDKTWCRSRGVVLEEIGRGEVSTRVEAIARPSLDPTVATEHEQWAWSDPGQWRRRDFDLMSSDANLGSGAMAGATGQVSPVVSASGLIVRTTSGDDLVATTPKTIDRWTSLWRMHPGGTLLTLAAFGDVLVVTTSQREVVAYSANGVRLWTRSLDDLAFWAPSRVDARRVAVADASGAVRVLDLLTGEDVWRQRVGGQVSGPVVGDPRAIVVLDAAGSATAFAASTGDRLWSKEVSSTTGAIVADTVVVQHAATLEALDLRTGRHRWLRPSNGTLDALVPFGNAIVAATQLGTQVIAADGTVLARLPAYEWVGVVGEEMVGRGRRKTEFRDRRYALIATIDTPDLTLSSTVLRPLAYRQGMVVFDRGWTFATWSDEP